METTKPILDIRTRDPRATVRVDGKPYELRRRGDLKWSEYQTFQRLAPRLGALISAPKLSSAEDRERSTLLDKATRVALIAPDAVLKKLGDLNRLVIVDEFYKATWSTEPKKAAHARPATRRGK